MRTLIGILETPPAAHVVDEHDGEVGAARDHISEKLLQARAMLEREAADAGVAIELRDGIASLERVGLVDQPLPLD